MNSSDQSLWKHFLCQTKKGELQYVEITKFINLMRTLYEGNPQEFEKFHTGPLKKFLAKNLKDGTNN